MSCFDWRFDLVKTKKIKFDVGPPKYDRENCCCCCCWCCWWCQPQAATGESCQCGGLWYYRLTGRLCQGNSKQTTIPNHKQIITYKLQSHSKNVSRFVWFVFDRYVTYDRNGMSQKYTTLWTLVPCEPQPACFLARSIPFDRCRNSSGGSGNSWGQPPP